eukprot:TRINITY_DN1814_c0_g1_i3.p2 TRINITY_DN1814_c0_g1~~TRINITY_DN1814_c0_g1_i3.p2  ORF type:complete len:220 (+),score=71.87 TRINITY_DN1814_c0_g1_i3:67-726(+)
MCIRDRAYINRMTGPKILELKNLEQLKAVIEQKIMRSILVGNEQKFLPLYEEIAFPNNDIGFFYANETIVKEIFTDVSLGQIIFLKESDEYMTVFKSEFTKENLKGFFELYKRPLVESANQPVMQKITQKGGPKALFLFRNKSAPGTPEIVEEFKKVAKSMRSLDQFFVETGITEGLEKKVAAYFGIEKTDLPTLEYIGLLYTSPSPRDLSTSRMPSSA